MTLLSSEIAEQPDVLTRLLDAELPRLPALRTVIGADDVTGVVIVARGSSDNAARYGQYLWGLRTHIPVALAAPSLLTVYHRRPNWQGRLVVAISQSGSSPDVIAVLRAGREQGCPTVALTNDPASPLAAEATVVINLGTGPERSVAATKTYTSSLLAVALLVTAFWPDAEAVTDLRAVPAAVAATLAALDGPATAAQAMHPATRAVAVGRGLNLGTAFEAALKITELTGTLVAPYSPADLLHGPVAAVGPQVPALLIAPDEPSRSSVLDIVPELRDRGAPVHIIASDPAALAAADVALPLPAPVAGWLTPLTAILPGQLLAQRLAELRGVEVDHPGGLAKVTRTT